MQTLVQGQERSEIKGYEDATEGPAASSISSLMMPAEATPIKVIALVEELGEMESPVELSAINQKLDRGSSNFLQVLAAAEKLGLIKRKKNRIALTDLGLGLNRSSDGKMRILRVHLSDIEPFKSTLELLSIKECISTKDVITRITENGCCLSNPKLSEHVIEIMLIEWGLSTELLKYDGKKAKFRLKMWEARSNPT